MKKELVFILAFIAAVLLTICLPAQTSTYVVTMPTSKIVGTAKYNDKIIYDPSTNLVTSSKGSCAVSKVMVTSYHGTKCYEIYAAHPRLGECVIAYVFPKNRRWSEVRNPHIWSDTPEPIILKPIQAKSK